MTEKTYILKLDENQLNFLDEVYTDLAGIFKIDDVPRESKHKLLCIQASIKHARYVAERDGNDS